MKFRHIGHTTSQYGRSFPLKLLVHGTGLLSLKRHHWLYLDQILFKISVHPFYIMPQKGPVEYKNRKEETLKMDETSKEI